MTDITMCSGTGCPIKEKCHRFTAERNPIWQSFFVEIPGKWTEDILNKQVWECDMFWGERQDDIMKQLKRIVGR